MGCFTASEMMNKLECVKDYWAAEGDKDLDRILNHFCDDIENMPTYMS